MLRIFLKFERIIWTFLLSSEIEFCLEGLPLARFNMKSWIWCSKSHPAKQSNSWLDGHLLLTLESGSGLTRGAHRRRGRGTAVDIEPQWLRSSRWQGLTCSTWGSRDGARRRLSLRGCQGGAEGGAGLWRLTTGQSGQSPSAYLEWTLQSDTFILPGIVMESVCVELQ